MSQPLTIPNNISDSFSSITLATLIFTQVSRLEQRPSLQKQQRNVLGRNNTCWNKHCRHWWETHQNRSYSHVGHVKDINVTLTLAFSCLFALTLSWSFLSPLHFDATPPWREIFLVPSEKGSSSILSSFMFRQKSRKLKKLPKRHPSFVVTRDPPMRSSQHRLSGKRSWKKLWPRRARRVDDMREVFDSKTASTCLTWFWHVFIVRLCVGICNMYINHIYTHTHTLIGLYNDSYNDMIICFSPTHPHLISFVYSIVWTQLWSSEAKLQREKAEDVWELSFG